MIKKEEIQTLLKQSLESGADFAELFFEDNMTNSLRITGQEVVSLSTDNVFGVGVRLLQGSDEVYGYTNKVDFDNIQKLMTHLKRNFKGPKYKVVPLGEPQPLKESMKKPFDLMTKKEKAKKLIKLSDIMKKQNDKIIQTIVNYHEKEQKILVANTEGVYQNDVRPYIRCGLVAVAKEGEQMQDVYEGPGRSMGLEFFDLIDLEQLAQEVAQRAVALLKAEEMKPQVMIVVLNNGFGGVIFHEACGHPLEATAIARGLSPFNNKLNQKIASDIVTAYDDGSIEGAWGKLNFDDEGMKTQKNLLIEKGILKSYLVDFRNGRKMKAKPTGSSRRESYKYSPTSRMNSTYIANGTDKPEQIIKDTKYGLYAKSLGGGTVEPATGEFNFVVKEGYLIEDGKLTTLVKGAMLIGYGDDVLLKIDRVGDNLSLGQGMCGSVSGSIPTDVGQPTIRVQEMVVGGNKKENA
ncbi:MAG: Zn-dependent protease [Candidatus Phytoplasma pruni]|uniref:TldD/PmbA family protein n=1 Tax=Poinsettia branch-inducing phytoplasma TaxID=138647 RepID=UPI000377810C|nr:TldD/PmbA family protein [Poinsettia branch-inducing phytoplasma]WEK82478.1 MAG: Zn-dependent protease [Candidatus Phytoplasma pruni]